MGTKVKKFLIFMLTNLIFIQCFCKRDMQETFHRIIFEYGNWRDRDTICGFGSTLEATEYIRAQLPLLCESLNIKTMLDVPCGDFNWMKEVSLPKVKYIGADVVKKLIIKNVELYSKENREFIYLDVTRDRIPKVDLILCKDLFIHFSFEDIMLTLKNFKASDAKYLLASTYMGEIKNIDRSTPCCRLINLQTAPFNFPAPLEIIPEKTELRHEYSKKVLALWRLDDISM